MSMAESDCGMGRSGRQWALMTTISVFQWIACIRFFAK